MSSAWYFKVVDRQTEQVTEYEADGIILDDNGVRLIRTTATAAGEAQDVAVFDPAKVAIVGHGGQLGDIETV